MRAERTCFGGDPHGNLQILQSAAGYYIGWLYYDDELKGWLPEARDSQRYWDTRDDAEFALMTNKYEVKF